MPVPAVFKNEQEAWSAAPLRFAGAMVAEAGELQPEVEANLALAAALTVRAAEEGHSCIDLAASRSPHNSQITTPAASHWLDQLRGIDSVVGNAGDYKPLVIDQGLLYLHRYWNYEKRVAEKLSELASQRLVLGSADETGPSDVLHHAIEALFPDPPLESPDWQRVAVALSTQRKLTVIAGGPGTGKTTTLVSLLALQQQLALERGAPLRIRLAAPTGKAAARMQEAVEGAIHHLWRSRATGNSNRPENAGDILKALPTKATTLHRLLGYLPGSPYFRHHAKKPLPLDLLVVDEASMVDLAMMAKLLDALPPHASLVLMGDRDQLASVEAGSVLGDICRLQPARAIYSDGAIQPLQSLCPGLATEPRRPDENAVVDSIVVLQTSRRFAADSGIGGLAAAVNTGDARVASEALASGTFDDIVLRQDITRAELVAAEVMPVWRRIMAADSAESALHAMSKLQLLCATRRGPQGVVEVNQLVAAMLERAQVTTAESGFFAGLPLMITSNDPNTDLANGDTGLIWPDTEGRLTFHTNSGNGVVRSIPLARLPDHEPSFAMTVHKSQGSEFDRVALLLPDNAGQVVSRELLYTAITRARSHVIIVGSESVLAAGIRQRVQRASGLTERLLQTAMVNV